MLNLEKDILIQTVKSIVQGKFPQWVLFRNGTYILFEPTQLYNISELKHVASAQLNEHGDYLGGWVVPFPLNSGIYTFIHSSEFEDIEPSELAISVLGRNKCLSDYEQEEILYIHSANGARSF